MSKANALRARAQGILDYFKPEEYDEGFELRSVPKVKPRDQYGKPVVEGGYDAAPTVTLSDLEGYPYLSTMSDRTAAGGQVVGIGDKNLAYPVNLTGGQDFMRDGLLWASGTMPINQMLQAGSNLKQQYGRNPALINWRMTPSGSDFSGEMTSGVMMSYASANMPAAVKKKLNADIRDRVPDFVGIDDPRAPAQIAMQPDRVRKFIQQQIMDKGYRDKGGISLPQARLAIADPTQLKAPTMGFQNVGLLDVDAGNLSGQGNIIYPDAVAGDFIGRLDTDATLIDLEPTAQYKSAGGIYGRPLSMGDFGPREAFSDMRRAAEVSPYGGIIDEDLLRRLEAKGIKVSANPLATAASLGLLGAAALGSEEADANPLAKLANISKLKEKGFNTDRVFYHASKQDIDKFKAGYSDGLIFLTPDPQFANNWLGKGKFTKRQGDTSTLDSLRAKKMRFREKHEKIMQAMPTDKEANEYYKEVVWPEEKKFLEAEKLTDSVIYPVFTRAKKTFDPQNEPELVNEILKMQGGEQPVLDQFGNPTGQFFVDVTTDRNVIDAYHKGKYSVYEDREIVNFLKEKGYDSMLLAEFDDGVQTTLAMFDPKDIRSVNAKGEQDDTDNILAGFSGTAATAGLLAAAQSEDTDASVLAKLPSVARLADKGFDTDNIYYHGTETFDNDNLDLTQNDIGFHVGAKGHANERLKSKAFPYDLEDGDRLPDDPNLFVEPSEGEFFPIAGNESRIMPFYIRKGEVLELPDFGNWNESDTVINGILNIKKGSLLYSNDPKFKKLIKNITEIKNEIVEVRRKENLQSPTLTNEASKEYETTGDLKPFSYMDFDINKKYLGKIRKAIQDAGYDTIKYTNLFERPDGKPMFGEDQYSYIALDGKNIRSVNAAALDDESSNIMSGVTGVAGASGLLAAGQSEEADASIVGVVSKLGFSRKDMLETAKLMEVEGQDKESIFRATGWERSGADGKWRTELPNTNSKINLDFLEEKDLVDFVSGKIELLGADDIDFTEETYELWEFFDDPELLDQYQPAALKKIVDDRHFADKYDMPREPLTMEQSDLIEKYGEPRYLPDYTDLEADEKVRGSRVAGSLKDIKVAITNELPPNDAYYNNYSDKIYIGAGVTQQEFRSLLLHELQHAIQAREGFARGSDPEYIEQVQTISDQYFNRGGQDEIDRLTALAEKYEAALRKGDTSQSTIEEAQAAQNLRTQKNRGLINEAMRKIQRNIDPNEELYVPPFRIYQETAGEVEARNVELRDQTRTLEAAEGESSLDQIPFYLTEKYASATVPQERQLVIYDNLVEEILGPFADPDGLFDDISVSKPITESAKESNAAIQKAKPALEKLSAPPSSTYEYGPVVIAKAEAEALIDAARLVARTFEDGFRMLVGGLGSAVEPESGRFQAQMDKPSLFGDYNQSTKDAMALLGGQAGEILMPAINFVMNPLFNTPSPISGRSLKQSIAKEITNIQDVYYSLPEPVQEEVAPRIGYAALAAMGALTFYLPLKPKTPKVEIPLLPEDNQGLLQIAN